MLFKGEDNRYYLRGIVSTGNKFLNLSISAFTDLTYHIDWLAGVAKEVSKKEGGSYFRQPKKDHYPTIIQPENNFINTNHLPAVNNHINQFEYPTNDLEGRNSDNSLVD